MEYALSVKNLRKTYANGVDALKGISLDVEQGDFFGLLGPNGAGKSTLIGIIAGLVKKTDGDVSVMGTFIDHEPEVAKSHIGIMPQEINLNIFDKCFDVLIQQAGYYGIHRDRASVNAEKYLKQLGLWEKRGSQVITLSGGMKRRLMIARALIHEPRVVILDEPTAGVDVELRRGMWDFLSELSAQGITIILTTHYLEEAEQLCKNLAIINQGNIVAAGSKRDLLSTLKGETFVLDLRAALPEVVFGKLSAFTPARADETTIELTLNPGQSLNQVFEVLSGSDTVVTSMRTKTNRLEELFVKLTSKNNV